MAYRTLIESTSLPTGLELYSHFRSSQIGRRYFGTIWNRTAWYPEDPELVAPEDCFHLHLEAQWHVLPKRFSLYIHYEPEPYQSEAQWKKTLGKKGYTGYLRKRERYVTLFRELASKSKMAHQLDWARAGRNQVARCDCLVVDHRLTVSEFQSKLAESIQGCHLLMNKALKKVNSL